MTSPINLHINLTVWTCNDSDSQKSEKDMHYTLQVTDDREVKDPKKSKYSPTGPVEKWEGSDKNLRNWPKIKWPIYIINH